ncbi:MAG: glycosyltransferase family 4 protein, partial [Cyanobacteria bacterium HKST-UBA02]|nr:glycosyltransferase family 4 protein [Cyanobacteria bacterium HKST-UBA02]
PTILMIGYIPVGYKGGYRIRIEEEIKALLKLGCRVHLACLLPPHNEESIQSHQQELESTGAQVYLIPSKSFFNVSLEQSSVLTELNLLKDIVNDKDVHILHCQALYSTRIALLMRDAGVHQKIVYDAHGITPEEEEMGGAHTSRIESMEQWEEQAVTSSELVIGVSECMKEHFQKKYTVPRSKFSVIPCGVSELSFVGQSVQEPTYNANRAATVVYMGSLAIWQCNEQMIQLCSQLAERKREYRFLFLLPEKDHEVANKLMVAHRIPTESVTIKEVSHSAIPTTIAHADIGLLLRQCDPVNQVSSPTKFGEYLAAGVPIILTDSIGDFSMMVQESDIGLVLESTLLEANTWPEDSIDKVDNFVERVIRERGEFAARCSGIARERLHWDTAARDLLASYRRLMARPSEEGF